MSKRRTSRQHRRAKMAAASALTSPSPSPAAAAVAGIAQPRHRKKQPHGPHMVGGQTHVAAARRRRRRRPATPHGGDSPTSDHTHAHRRRAHAHARSHETAKGVSGVSSGHSHCHRARLDDKTEDVDADANADADVDVDVLLEARAFIADCAHLPATHDILSALDGRALFRLLHKCRRLRHHVGLHLPSALRAADVRDRLVQLQRAASCRADARHRKRCHRRRRLAMAAFATAHGFADPSLTCLASWSALQRAAIDAVVQRVRANGADHGHRN